MGKKSEQRRPTASAISRIAAPRGGVPQAPQGHLLIRKGHSRQALQWSLQTQPILCACSLRLPASWRLVALQMHPVQQSQRSGTAGVFHNAPGRFSQRGALALLMPSSMLHVARLRRRRSGSGQGSWSGPEGWTTSTQGQQGSQGGGQRRRRSIRPGWSKASHAVTAAAPAAVVVVVGQEAMTQHKPLERLPQL